MENIDKAHIYDHMTGVMDVVVDYEVFVKKNGQIKSTLSFDDDEYLIVVISTREGMTLEEAKKVYGIEDNY